MRTTLRPWLLGAESLNNFASRRVKRYSWRMFLRLQEILWVFIGTAHSFVIYLLMYFVLYVVYICALYGYIYTHTYLDTCYTPYLHRSKYFIWIWFKIICAKQATSNFKSILSGMEVPWWEMLIHDHKGVLMICECKL